MWKRFSRRCAIDRRLASVRSSIDNGELPVWVSLKDSPAVVFTFTGAANRNSPLPQFASTGLGKQLQASVIALADPSLVRHDELRLAWYAGHEGFELQKMLPSLIQQIIDTLGATRVAFVGGSGGGFAALYYSSKVPGSVAVVLNPQTNLNHYHWRHRKWCRDICWPGLGTSSLLDAAFTADLTPLYADHVENTVICIQIASDFFHLTRQVAPFLAALPDSFRNRLIVRVANWGVDGHKPAPTSIWIPWLEAALAAPDTSAASIEESWVMKNPVPRPPLRSPSATSSKPAPPSTSGDTEYPLRRAVREPSKLPKTRDEEIAAWLAYRAAGTLLSAPMTPDDLA